MAKSKVKVEGNTISGTAEAIMDVMQKATDRLQAKEEIKPYEITHASIKEEECNYGYEIKTGKTAGDKIPTRKGEAIVHNDMINAFDALRVHLAVSDDAFKHIYTELPELDELKEHEVVEAFYIAGFKVQGVDEDEGYLLSGHKWVTLGSMGINTPKITKNNYKFFDDLKEQMDLARFEVEEYMNGKHRVDVDEEENQPELPFGGTSASEFEEEE